MMEQGYYWVIEKNSSLWEIVWFSGQYEGRNLSVYRFGNEKKYELNDFERWVPVEFTPETPTVRGAI